MDYASVSRSLTFNAAVTTQIVELYVIDDHIVEHSEVINLTLISTDSAVLLKPSTTTITIEDVESKLYVYIYGSAIAAIYSYTGIYSLLQWWQSDSLKQPILWVKMQTVSVSQCLYKQEPWTEMS